MRPHGWQPTRLPRPWDSPGKNTGVGCHFLLQCMKVKVKSLSRVWLLATLRTASFQAPPYMGFSRQEYWTGLLLPSPSGFPYFLEFKSEFGNKEFMIWATVSSRSCFCWLYRASPLLAAKNTISLILVLTIWWCPCVESSLVLLEEGVCYDQCILLAKLYSPLPCFIPYSKAKFASYSRCFLTSYFCIPVPYNEKDIFGGVLVLKGLVGFHRTVQLQLLQCYWLGHTLGLIVILNGLPWKQTEIILSFLRLHPSTAFQTLLLTMMATPFLLRDSTCSSRYNGYPSTSRLYIVTLLI